MAGKSKKTRAKKVRTKNKGETELMNSIIVPKEGYVNVPLTYAELDTLVTLLNASTEAYTLLAKRTADIGDVNTSNILASRAQLCDLFVSHLNTHLMIEEPESRHKH